MVKIALFFKANLENLRDLKTSGLDFRWCLKFTCSNCGEKPSKWNYLSLNYSVPYGYAKDAWHFTSKCKLCFYVNTVNILPGTVASYEADDGGKYKKLVVFDCRGVEPYDFSPGEGWIVKAANNGKEFKDVDLSEKEWVDYCDKTYQAVGIYQVEHYFQRVKSN